MNQERNIIDNKYLLSKISVSSNLEEAVLTKNPCVILTEWDEFKEIFTINKNSKVLDFRNIIKNDKTIFNL